MSGMVRKPWHSDRSTKRTKGITHSVRSVPKIPTKQGKTIKVIVHLGFSKTGSTFLQKSFFPTLEKTVFLTNKEEGNNFPFFQNEISKWFTINDNVLDDTYIDEIHKKLSQLCEDEKNQNVLISSEEFSGFDECSFLDYQVTANNLKTILGTPKVIFIIRKQDDLIESLYRDNIRQGYFLPIKYYTNYHNGEFNNFQRNRLSNIDVRLLNWEKYTAFYEKLFGEENVLVMPFEMLKEQKETFLKRITDFIGVAYPHNIDQKHENVSHLYLSSVVMRFLNRFVNNGRNPFYFIIQNPLVKILPVYHADENKLITFLRRVSERMLLRNVVRFIDKIIPVKRDFLDPVMRKKILQIHAQSNRRLSEKKALELDRYGYC